MLRAGIITFHNAENYGAALQTYALKSTLKKMGCDTRVIDYRNRGVFLRNTIKNLYYAFTMQRPLKNHRQYQRFQNQHLNLSDRTYMSVTDFETDADDFDVLFFGSDQIWNPDLSNGFDPFYFGQFRTKARKVAYAASVGKDRLSAQEEQTLNTLSSTFDAISVREESAVQVFNQDVSCVVDPCMLLSAAEWRELSPTSTIREPYLLIYQLHPDKRLLKAAVELARPANKKIYMISPYLDFRHCKLTHNLGRISPREFISYYDQADLVLSDSFHGTIFSILFEKPFYTFLPGEKTGRITSLLAKLNLSERIVTDDSLPEGEINFESANPLVEKEVSQSLEYIRRNLI